METRTDTEALVALLRTGRHSWKSYAAALVEAGSARALLDDEQGLFAETALTEAAVEVAGWRQRGIQVLSVLDPGYPANVRRAAESPPLLFVAGDLRATDDRSVAVIGTRQPTPGGKQMARALSHRLVDQGYTVISGLAAGIDTVAHQSALEKGGRTVAVIGSGLDHCYPRENTPLQRRISREGAVISQFWPESRPSRASFPLRNALMAGLADASVIVEANAMSGTRIQARAAIGMRRIVVLIEALLEQQWARELSEQPGVQVARSAADVTAALEQSLARPALA